MKLNCAIIGLGVGEKHLQTLLKIKQTNISCLCDFDNSKLKKITKKYSKYKKLSNCKFLDNFEELLKFENLDLIIISSYDNFHSEQIIKLAKKNINFFVEKPLCQNRNEFNIIKNTIKKYKINISSNFVLREHPVFLKLKKKIKEDKLGKIYHFESEYNYGRINKIHKGWRGKINYYSVNQGGAIHMLDLILHLKKMKIQKIFAVGNNISSKNSTFKYPDIVTSILKFNDNTTAKITSNFSSVSPHHHKFSVFGTKGSFEFNYLNNIYFFSRDYEKKKIKIEKNTNKFNKSVVLKNFIHMILTKNKQSLIKHKNDLFNVTDIILKIDKKI